MAHRTDAAGAAGQPLADGPFGPWRELNQDDDPTTAHYWLVREFGGIYRGMAHLGYRKHEVDALEVWEAASILGADLPDTTDVTGPPPRGKRNLVRERELHAMDPSRYPKPEARPMPPDEVAGLLGEIGGLEGLVVHDTSEN